METYTQLYSKVCSKENLVLAWKKARKRKTLKNYVIKFEENLNENIQSIRTELLFHSYRPQPLENFILRDPKTRKISVSQFRDRIVHHAICNIIEPIFEKKFIHDSFANQKGKGTLAALQRLDFFINKVSKNGTIVNKYSKRNIRGFILKGDLKHYFDTVSHGKLLEIISRTIKDKELLFLIRNILKNHQTKVKDRGMPLGNLTSQFLANVYLNELDQFVKRELKARYYIRYVDDFVILHQDHKQLEYFYQEINRFLREHLLVELNLDKSEIKTISRGVEFLGFRNFYHHKRLRARNIRQFFRKYKDFNLQHKEGQIDYDKIYDFMEGWIACAKHANTYNFRQKIIAQFERDYLFEISSKEINRGREKRKKK